MKKLKTLKAIKELTKNHLIPAIQGYARLNDFSVKISKPVRGNTVSYSIDFEIVIEETYSCSIRIFSDGIKVTENKFNKCHLVRFDCHETMDDLLDMFLHWVF